MPGQAGQASRHNRLKSVGSRRKQVPPSEGATPFTLVGVTHSKHPQQASCSLAAAQPAMVGLPLPGSTLQAQVSGIPHTQLVLNTMQQLNRTLSPESHPSASTKGLSQPGMPTPATSDAAAAAAAVSLSAACDASAQAQGIQQAGKRSAQLSMPAGPSPVLQPFLAAVGEEQAHQSGPELIADAHGKLQGADEEAPAAKRSWSLPQPGSTSPDSHHSLHNVERQAEGQGEGEGQSSEQADRQLQKQTTSAVEQKEGGPMAHMQTGSALQQLISRAQKLKQQLDAHAAGRYDRQIQLVTPVQCAVACCLLACVPSTLCHILHRDAVHVSVH